MRTAKAQGRKQKKKNKKTTCSGYRQNGVPSVREATEREREQRGSKQGKRRGRPKAKERHELLKKHDDIMLLGEEGGAEATRGEMAENSTAMRTAKVQGE